MSQHNSFRTDAGEGAEGVDDQRDDGLHHAESDIPDAGGITMETGFEDGDDDEDLKDEGSDDSGLKGDKPKPKIGKKKPGGSGRRRIEIKFIENKSRRQVTFSRRKRGLMKKAYELTTLTGTQALVLIASETGHVYTFATPKLQPVVTLREGKELIQSCLNAPDTNYPPSDYMPNASNNGPSNGGSPPPVHQTPKTEPHASPPMTHPQHAPHGQHPGHPHHHDPMMSNLYGGGLPTPHGVSPHGAPYPSHMGPGGYPHDMYLPGGQAPLPPMSLGHQHLGHHDGKRDM